MQAGSSTKGTDYCYDCAKTGNSKSCYICRDSGKPPYCGPGSKDKRCPYTPDPNDKNCLKCAQTGDSKDCYLCEDSGKPPICFEGSKDRRCNIVNYDCPVPQCLDFPQSLACRACSGPLPPEPTPNPPINPWPCLTCQAAGVDCKKCPDEPKCFVGSFDTRCKKPTPPDPDPTPPEPTPPEPAPDYSKCWSCVSYGIGCDECPSDPQCFEGSKDTRCPQPTPPVPPDPTPPVPPDPTPPVPPDPTPPVPPDPTPPVPPDPTPPVPPDPTPPVPPDPTPPVPPDPTPPVPPPVPPPPPLPPIPIDPQHNDKNPFPRVPNDALPNFGLPLTCFKETRNGKDVFGCFDERGVRFEYRGPPHPNSTTTIYGNWVGPAPYANDLPTKVKGRVQAETSALDSFGLLYTTLCYDYGFHITEIDQEYTSRIQSALARGIISSFRSANEFDAAMKIVRSFQRTGHIFDVVNAFGETEYATRLGAIPKSVKWMKRNAEMTYPVFDLTNDQKRMLQQAFELNPDVRIEDVQSLLRFMESAGLTSSYPYIWLAQRQFNTMQSQYAFTYLQKQVQELNESSGILPPWAKRQKNDPLKQLQAVVSLDSLTTDLTASVLETLL